MLEQSAAREGVTEVPPPDDPQYATLRDSAMNDLLLGRWVRGEASERGITFSESEISTGLDGVIEQDFGGQKEFEKFLKQAHFTDEQARERGPSFGCSATSSKSASSIRPRAFRTPRSRTSTTPTWRSSNSRRRVTCARSSTSDQAKLEQAKALLEEDDSPASWKKVAARFSTEEATKDIGGVREGVTEGQSEPAVEEQIFSAAEGQLVGPFEGQTGSYLIQVEKITPAVTTPIAEVTEQIQQQLTQGKQQQVAQDFQQDFLEKWRSRTFCADDYLIDSCDNSTPPLFRRPRALPRCPRHPPSRRGR